MGGTSTNASLADGVRLDASSVGSSGASAITITGTAAQAGSAGIAMLGANSVVGGATASGNLSLIADKINIAAGRVQTTGTIALGPLTASRQIALGSGATDTGTRLGLDDTEIARLFANNVVIGGVNQSGNITVVGVANFANMGAGGTLALQAGNGASSSGLISVANTLTTAGHILVSTANGNVSFDTASGTIGLQSGAGKTITVSAANGTITSTNGFANAADANTGAGGAVSLSARQGIGSTGNAIVVETGAISANNSTSGDVVLQTGSSLTLGGGSTIVNNAAGGGLDITVTGANSSITIGTPLTANGTAVSTNNGNVVLTAGNSIVFAQGAGNTGINSGTANTTLTAGTANTAGSIVGQSANADDVRAGSLSVTANSTAGRIGAVAALQSSMTLSGGNTITLAAGGNIDLQEANALPLANVTVSGAAPNITLRSASGPITVGAANFGVATANLALIANTGNIVGGAGNLVANTLTLQAGSNIGSTATPILSAANGLVLSGNDATVVNNAALNIGASSLSGNLSVTSRGTITQSGVITANAGVATFNTQNLGDVTLNTAANNFDRVVIAAANEVALRSAAGLNFGTSSLTGNLTVTANGPVTQTGSITANGANTFASFNAGAGGNIALDNVSNNFNEVRIVAGNNVALVDANNLILGASTVNGNYDVTAKAGNITTTGVLALNGLASTIRAESATSSAGNITINNNINHTNASASTLTLAANGSIVLDAAAKITANTGGGALAVTFDADHNGTGGRIFLNIGTSIASNGGNIVLGGGATGANAATLLSGMAGAGVHLSGANLNSGNGAITITGRAGDAGTHGVLVSNGSVIQSTNGTISISGNAGASGNAGVALLGGQILGNGSAAITITGAGGNGILHATGVTIGGSNATGDIQLHSLSGAGITSNGVIQTSGNITLVADSMTIQSGATLNSSAGGTITLTPDSPGQAIELGTGANTAVLGLDNPALSRLFANNVVIGGASYGGNITVVGATGFAGMGNAGTLTLNVGNATLAGQILVNSNLSAPGNVTLTTRLGDISFNQTTAVTGVTSGTGKAITLDAAGGSVTSANANLDANAGAGGNVIVSAGVNIGTAANPIQISAANLA